MAEYKDKNSKEIKQGDTVLVPFKVVKLAGNRSELVHLETIEAYGHANPHADGPLKGRTKTAFWAEPNQIEVAKES